MIVTTKELFQHAYGKYAVGAYNINNLEQTVGLFRGNLGKRRLERRAGRPGQERPVHHPDFPRCPRLYRQAVPGGHDPHGRGGLSRGDFRRPPRSRHRGGLLRLHRQRLLLLGDDRRLARDVRRRTSPSRGASSSGPTRRASSVEAELGMLGGVEEDIGRRQRLPDRSRPGGRVRREAAAAIRWPWPSAPRTAPTSSPASRGCTSTGSPRFRKRLPRLSAGDARIEQRAQGMGRSDQQGRRQDEGEPAACPRINTCRPPSWA